jgi:hypothetical protein
MIVADVTIIFMLLLITKVVFFINDIICSKCQLALCQKPDVSTKLVNLICYTLCDRENLYLQGIFLDVWVALYIRETTVLLYKNFPYSFCWHLLFLGLSKCIPMFLSFAEIAVYGYLVSTRS